VSQLDLETYALLERARQRMAHPPQWWPPAARKEAKALEAELYAAQEALLPREKTPAPATVQA